MTPDKVGFAILGAGMVADYHRQAIEVAAEDGAELVAIGHHAPDRFGELGEKFGVPAMDLDGLLGRDDVDVVCLCTPSGRHAGQALAAVRASKHVVVEKPMTLSLEDADAVIAAAEENGVKLGVVLQRRAEPFFEQVKRAVDAGDLGRLTLGSVLIPYHRPQEYFESAGWRGTWALDGGGVLMNQGIHLIDLLVWYMGDPIKAEARAGTLDRDVEVEDTVAATLEFENGALATVTATTTAAPGFPHRVELYGTGGGIQIEGESARSWSLSDPDTATVEPPASGEREGAGSGGDPRGISPTGHISIIRDFTQAVRDDRPPMIPGREGRRSLAAILKIYEAAGLLSAKA